MKKFRFISLALLALLLVLVPAALAQSGDTLGASQDDFTLWTTANGNFASASTFSFDFTTSLKVTGMQSSNVSADLKGSGVLDTNQANPAFQLDVTGNVVQGTDTTPVNAGVRIVNGNLYFSTDGTSWQGGKLQDIAQQFTQGFAQGFSSGL